MKAASLFQTKYSSEECLVYLRDVIKHRDVFRHRWGDAALRHFSLAGRQHLLLSHQINLSDPGEYDTVYTWCQITLTPAGGRTEVAIVFPSKWLLLIPTLCLSASFLAYFVFVNRLQNLILCFPATLALFIPVAILRSQRTLDRHDLTEFVEGLLDKQSAL